MRIQRYIAKDMRTALAQVREALGPDAVILSSGRIGDEVEVVAAMDMEVARAVENAPPATRVPERETFRRPEAPAAVAAAEPRHAELLKHRRSSSQISESLAPVIQVPLAPAAPVAVTVPPAAGQEQLVGEMKDMRRMLEAQLATLAWNDLSRRSPVQAAMHKELAQLGITQDLANSLIRKLLTDSLEGRLPALPARPGRPGRC